MIISNESFLRFPPHKLETRQATIFNAITYCVDICDISYSRLLNQVRELSINPKTKDQVYASIFADAWAVINNSTIFLSIVTRHLKAFDVSKMQELGKAKALRNSNQHLDERISEVFISKNWPIYGSLSWIHNLLNSDKFVHMYLSAGIFTHHNEFVARVQPGRITQYEFEDLILKYVVKQGRKFIELEVNLKSLMKEVVGFVDMLEERLSEQVLENEETLEVKRHGANLLIALDGRVLED